MKRLFPAVLAVLLLLSLAACQPSVSEPSAPSDEVTAPAVSPETASTPPVLTADGDSRYFFAAGNFMGSWSDGQWHSAHDTDFTLAEVFNRTYYNSEGSQVRAARFSIAWDAGQLDEQDVALLEPFGIVEGSNLVLKMPAQFTGEAAGISVPNYSFAAAFDGQYAAALSDAPLIAADTVFSETALPDDDVTQALASVGITCDLSRTERMTLEYDLDGDGQNETLELIQPLRDDANAPMLEDSEQLFYALLVFDGGKVSVVTSEAIDYNRDDMTTLFYAFLNIVCDVNGDGTLEITVCVSEWEWGHYAVFSLENGQWTEVLRANYGM